MFLAQKVAKPLLQWPAPWKISMKIFLIGSESMWEWKKNLGGVYNFSSLYGLLCFWVIYAVKRRRADSRDLIKKVYFAMKIQISRLSARCPLMVCIGNNDKWPAPISHIWWWWWWFRQKQSFGPRFFIGDAQITYAPRGLAALFAASQLYDN